MSELDKINEEIKLVQKNVLEPLYAKQRAIFDQLSFERNNKIHADYNNNIAGKLFYGDKTTWNGYTGTICLIKPLFLDEVEHPNTCKVVQLVIRIANEERNSMGNSIISFDLKFESVRTDMFTTHYKEISEDSFPSISDNLKQKLETILRIFNPSTTNESNIYNPPINKKGNRQ